MAILSSIYSRYLRHTRAAEIARRFWYADRSNRAPPRLPRPKPLTIPGQVLWYRARYVGKYYGTRIRPALRWLIRSRETSNFTYDLTRRNLDHLAELLAVGL